MAMRIAYAVARQIADLAQAQVPHEVCGLLAGKGDDISKCLPVSNIAGSREDQYELDPGEELKALKAIDAAGLRWIGIYHSHPFSAPIPSAADIRAAVDQNLLHLIVSLERRKPRLTLWRIEAEAVVPVELVFDTEEAVDRDQPLSRAQQGAIIAVGVAALLLLLFIAFSLLPPAPDIKPAP